MGDYMKTWKNIDKSEWARGEWDDEPDKAHWVYNGIDCLIVRGPSGALCGYVGVPIGHRLYEVDYNEAKTIDDEYIECHGGLTFSKKCAHTEDEGKHICHPKDSSACEDVWWLGFDCAHAWDISPSYIHRFGVSYEETYRDFNYVKNQVEYLADQVLKG